MLRNSDVHCTRGVHVGLRLRLVEDADVEQFS